MSGRGEAETHDFCQCAAVDEKTVSPLIGDGCATLQKSDAAAAGKRLPRVRRRSSR